MLNCLLICPFTVRVFNKFFLHSHYLQNSTAVFDTLLAFLVTHSVKVVLIAKYNPVSFFETTVGAYTVPGKRPLYLSGVIYLNQVSLFLSLGMNTKDFKYKWGGEDWDLLDRVLMLPVEVERIRHPGLYHHYHDKQKMWN